MSLVRFARSPDLEQLRGDGYTVSVEETGYVVVRDVPYVTPQGSVSRGILAYPVNASGDAAGKPTDHVAFFAGVQPCDAKAAPYDFASGGSWEVARDVTASFQLSLKNPEQPIDPDLHTKFKRYIDHLQADAQGVEPGVTAALRRPIVDEDPDSPFEYLDTATSRAGIYALQRKFEQQRIGIVGLGGTGSYILDQVAKTRVSEIHLFDDDVLLTHNAFRAPGAASLAELNEQPRKVDYYAAKYSAMKRGIHAHPYALDATNAEMLNALDFIFLSMEGGHAKRQLVEALQSVGIPFIDVSLDVVRMGDGLGGSVQVATSTPERPDAVARRVSFDEPTDDDVYSSNIQIADLNALNAVLAVIRWKKLRGFYNDQRSEMFCAYRTDTNSLISEEEP